MTPDETRLLRAARQAYPEWDYHELTPGVLAEISRERGVDFATILLYDRIRRSAEHGPFIAEIEAMEPDLEALPRIPGKTLIAPAAFYREHPRFGGDGRRVREIAEAFGMETALLPVPSTGGVTESAFVVAEALAAEPDGSVILVSLSKGGADARIALERGGAAIGRKVRAWVQIGGLIHGSPLMDDLRAGGWWRRGVVRGFLALTPARPQLLAELAHAPGSLLARPAHTPPGVPGVINVVGFPLARHLSTGGTRVRYRRLAHGGPNDGLTLLRDAVVEPGFVYPLWGADHYFRGFDAVRLLYRLFLFLARADASLPRPVTTLPHRGAEAMR